MNNPTPGERHAKSVEDKRVATIRVIANGYLLRTRSGQWFYPDITKLFDALRAYLELIKREDDQHEKETN